LIKEPMCVADDSSSFSVFSQVCLFCYNKIKEQENGKCPACRRQYTDEPQQIFLSTE
jgi:hypothetical protein